MLSFLYAAGEMPHADARHAFAPDTEKANERYQPHS